MTLTPQLAQQCLEALEPFTKFNSSEPTITVPVWSADVTRARAASAALREALASGEGDEARDAARYRWLRQSHEESDTGESICVFQPDYGAHCLEPVGSMPGELDAAIDAAMKGNGK